MENQREQLLTKYARMFTAVDNYLNTANEVQKLNNQLELLKMERNEILAGDYVFACIGAVIGAILFPFIFGNIISIGFFTGVIFGLIGLIGFFFLFNKIGNILFREKREEEANEYHKKFIEPKNAELLQAIEALEIIENDPGFIDAQNPDLLPEDYQSLEALQFFVKALTNRRTDSEKELYNLYEQRLEHCEILDKYSEQSRILKKSMASIAKAQSQIAAQNELLSKQVRYSNIVATVNLLKKK